MKFILLFLCVTTVELFDINAQIKTENLQDAVIALDKLDVLYSPFENPLSVSVSGPLQKDIIFKGSEGVKFEKLRNGHYMVQVYPIPPNEKVTITTFVKGIPRGKKTFRVEKTPKRISMFGNIQSGKITVAEVLLQQNIHYGFWPNFAFNYSYSVTKYTIIYNTKIKNDNGEYSIRTNSFAEYGSVITLRIKEALLKVKSGDKINIIGIQAMGSGKSGLWSGFQKFIWQLSDIIIVSVLKRFFAGSPLRMTYYMY
ncbi:MAG: GldM family protein [Bacteroidota bacterium]|nr:GldM family protein [Bacteroidota bacterium]